MYYRTGDAYVDGIYVEGSESQTNIVASVQRLSEQERQLLPEGFRASESIKIFTEYDPIQVIDNDLANPQDSAEFLYQGKRYVMLGWEKWGYLIPYWKVTAVAKP